MRLFDWGRQAVSAGVNWMQSKNNTPNTPENTPIIQTLSDRYSGPGRFVYSANVGLYLPGDEDGQVRTVTLSVDKPVGYFDLDTVLSEIIIKRKTPESGDYISEEFGTVLVNVWIARKY